MTTKEIANKLVELYNEGQSLKAEETLYASDVKSFEQDSSRNAQGLEAIMAKTKAAGEMFKTMNKNEATVLGVNNDSFLVKFDIDAVLQDGNSMKMLEYGFYKVVDGKVAYEYFFFA